jgi:hypothetical protein
MQATCRNKEAWGHIWHASHLPSPTKQNKWQNWWQQEQATQYHRHTPQQYTIHIHNITRHKPPTKTT